MRQFIQWGDAAYAHLEERATRSCVVFYNEELPAGSLPPRARIGFEINPADGTACLLVDRGIEYFGTNSIVEKWFTKGGIIFPSFDHLRLWIQDELGACYGDAVEQVSDDRTRVSPAL